MILVAVDWPVRSPVGRAAFMVRGSPVAGTDSLTLDSNQSVVEISRLSFGTTAKPGLETFLSSAFDLQKQRLQVVSNPFAVSNSTPSIVSLVA